MRIIIIGMLPWLFSFNLAAADSLSEVVSFRCGPAIDAE